MKSFWPSLDAWLRKRAFLITEHKVNLWSAIVMIVWSVIVDWNKFDLITNPNYQVATKIFTHEQWKSIVFSVGCIQLLGLLSGYKLARIFGTSLAGWVFLTLGYSITVSGHIARDIAPGVAMTWGWGAVNIHSMLSVVRRKRTERS